MLHTPTTSAGRVTPVSQHPTTPPGTSPDTTADVGQLATNMSRVIEAGVYQPGSRIPVQQLSADFNAPLHATICAVHRLHDQDVLELLELAPEMKTERPDAGPAARRVAQGLRERITAGMYPEGAALPTQQALARALHAGTSTVNKALGVLAPEGWIERKPGRAAIATHPARDARFVRIPVTE